ncbi:MAG: hypothetical protein MZV63_62670 [Marinilabiliales bacterium]|nr:hypothetical protein [Marinilabiliales bacterium]
MMSYLSGYGFDKIRVPVDKYYLFDSIRMILPVIQPDSSATDSVAGNRRAGRCSSRPGRILKKVKLSADSKPVMHNDTLRLNDSVYILMKDFIPAQLPHQHQ